MKNFANLNMNKAHMKIPINDVEPSLPLKKTHVIKWENHVYLGSGWLMMWNHHDHKKKKKIIWLIGKALLARLWMAYQVGYRSTTTCIRVTTHIRFLMLISGVEPKPSPRRPAVLTWLSAVSCDTRRETSSLWRSKQAYTHQSRW